jgi:hypothetical protein
MASMELSEAAQLVTGTHRQFLATVTLLIHFPANLVEQVIRDASMACV